jgi:hypothetical protein
LGNATERRQGNCASQGGAGKTPDGAQNREAKVKRLAGYIRLSGNHSPPQMESYYGSVLY